MFPAYCDQASTVTCWHAYPSANHAVLTSASSTKLCRQNIFRCTWRPSKARIAASTKPALSIRNSRTCGEAGHVALGAYTRLCNPSRFTTTLPLHFPTFHTSIRTTPHQYSPLSLLANASPHSSRLLEVVSQAKSRSCWSATPAHFIHINRGAK